MNSASEGYVAFLGSSEIEAIGVGKDFGVPVGRPQQGDHPVTGANLLAADVEVLAGNPAIELDRRVVPKQFADSSREHVGMLAQALKLIGMTQERQHPVSDQVARGLVPGDEQEHQSG